MATIKLSEDILSQARIASKVLKRSISEQIEYWVKIGMISEENPDLNFDFIKDILIAQEEAEENKLEPYV